MAGVRMKRGKVRPRGSGSAVTMVTTSRSPLSMANVLISTTLLVCDFSSSVHSLLELQLN